jgi:rubrerythrin
MNTYKEVIAFAIKREEDAIQGYGSMIEVAKTPGISKLLEELQEEERKHKQLLQELTEGKVESYVPTKVIDLKISDYLEEDTLDAEMDFQQLLIFAAKKEQNAVKLYSKLAEEVESEELKKLFEFLVEQEKSHKLKLETEYEKHVLEWD